MKKYESEMGAHLAMVAAEVEAEIWNKENAERRTNFMTRRLAALAIEDSDPLDDDVFDRIAA